MEGKSGAAVAATTDSKLLAEIFALVDDCTAKLCAEGEAGAKAYKDVFCMVDAARDAQFQIKIGKGGTRS